MPILKVRSSVQTLTVVAALLVPVLAHAQDQRLRLSFGGATTAGTLDSQPSIAASVGYRFADRLWFDVEVTASDGTNDRFSSVPFFGRSGGQPGIVRFGSTSVGGRPDTGVRLPSRDTFVSGPAAGALFAPADLRLEREGNTALATFGFRYDLPSQIGRFQPYVNGGIGFARTEETVSVLLASGMIAAPGMAGRPGMNIVARPGANIDDTLSHTGLATSAGVGASIRLFKQLSADLDAKYFRLDRGRNLGRFGGGVSYRF